MMTIEQMTVTQQDDMALVAECRRGNREAFRQVVERNQTIVCSVAYAALGNKRQSEEVAQETFITAWRQLAVLREPAKLRAWLCGIARFLAGRELRRQGREPLHDAEPLEAADQSATSELLPPEQAMRAEELELLWRALEWIPTVYREPLVLFYREHRSVERVADALGLSEDAVKQRLSRGRRLLQDSVLAMVEGGLEATRPDRMFALDVLAALPALSATATVAAVGATTKGGVTSKSAALIGAMGSILTAGLIFTFSVLGLLGFLGACLGLVMSRASARAQLQREHAMRFWRALALSTVVVVVPMQLLRWALPTSYLFEHPALFRAMTWWLELIYPAVGVIVGIWLYRWWRGLTGVEEATSEPARQQPNRFALWFALGWVLPAGFCGLFFYSMIFQTTLTGRRVTSVEMQKIVTERQDAHLRMTQYADGAKKLRAKLPEDGRRVEYWTRADDATLALLDARKTAYPISVEGRDFIESRAPWRWLALLSCFIAPIGGMLLLRWPGRGRQPLAESDPACTERTATKAFAVGLALALVAFAVFFGLITRWHLRTLSAAEVGQIVTAHRAARVEIFQYDDASREVAITLSGSRESPTFKASADDTTLAMLSKEGIAYQTSMQGRDFGFRSVGRGAAVVYIVLLIAGALGLLWFAKRGLVRSVGGTWQ